MGVLACQGCAFAAVEVGPESVASGLTVLSADGGALERASHERLIGMLKRTAEVRLRRNAPLQLFDEVVGAARQAERTTLSMRCRSSGPAFRLVTGAESTNCLLTTDCVSLTLLVGADGARLASATQPLTPDAGDGFGHLDLRPDGGVDLDALRRSLAAIRKAHPTDDTIVVVVDDAIEPVAAFCDVAETSAQYFPAIQLGSF
ncbi:MAG: hypothetical protein U0228_02405 [Myxococcaceae bacterium]